MNIRSPATIAAVAALLASTTGYCVLRTGDPPAINAPAHLSPPVRILPEALDPYPLADDG